MTENEAIRDLDIIRFNPHWDELVNEEYWQELMEMAIKALEEVQKYRATTRIIRDMVEEEYVFAQNGIVISKIFMTGRWRTVIVMI